MPRPCAVEIHARCSEKQANQTLAEDATALRRGDSRSQLRKAREPDFGRRCHGLAPWRFTLAAQKSKRTRLWPKMPRPCAVEIHARCLKVQQTTPSSEREVPWHEAMASLAIASQCPS